MRSITAVGVMIMSGDKVLLLKRHPDTLHPLMWGIVAGSIEKEEFVVDALIREIKEELNYDMLPDKFEFVDEFYYPDFPEVNGNYELTFHLYKVEVPEQFTPNLNKDEHLEARWVTREEAMAMQDTIESMPDMLDSVYSM